MNTLDSITKELITGLESSEKSSTILPVKNSSCFFMKLLQKGNFYLPLNAITVFNHVQMPIGFYQFMGPIPKEDEKGPYSLYISEFGLFTDINQELGADPCLAFFVKDPYKGCSGEYKGIAKAMVSVSLSFAEKTMENRAYFIVSRLNGASAECLARYPGFNVYKREDITEAAFYIPNPIKPINIEKL